VNHATLVYVIGAMSQGLQGANESVYRRDVWLSFEARRTRLCVRYCQREIVMDLRWEALYGVVSVAIPFVPLFVVMFAGVNHTRKRREAERERRLAAYRGSPESQLLRLT
jgi:hypothetical protein